MNSRPSLDRFLPEFVPHRESREAEDAEAAAGARAYLLEVRGSLEALQAAGAPGQEVNEANSDALDRLLRRLHGLAESRHYADGGEVSARVSIIAVGGYARREMSIGSDVDLLFLHTGEISPLAAHLAERIQYWLWDAGAEVGGAVRSIEETLSLCRSEPSVFTTIIGARFLVGDVALFHEFTDAIRDDLLAKPADFVTSQAEALIERHERFGGSLYLLQPNLKEGVGGLRDYHTALWVARATQPLVRTLDDLIDVGLLSELEMERYREGLQFLWRVRNQLHLICGRKNDQMSFEHQEEIAAAITRHRSDSDLELPVEHFMRDYYRQARSVASHSQIVIEQCQVRCSSPMQSREVLKAEDGFQIVENQLEIPHAAHLREQPVRLLTCFETAQKHDVPLSRRSLRLIGENLGLVDDDFRADRETAATLLRLLESKFRVMRTLVAMNEIGLLGRYLPEWEHIVCRWQHVIYHTYTVDVHSIFLVEELRRLWRGKHQRAYPGLTDLMRSVSDLPVLYLGCLLHDIGKARGGDHSEVGAKLAWACLNRLGLSSERVARAVFIVRHHLLMPHVAQRRDLTDPKVIVDFARVVGDRENLRNLYLATYADMRASSPSAWNEWKGASLAELFGRTSEFLESGRDDPHRAVEQMEAHIETRREDAKREIRGLGIAESRVDAYFGMMPRRYFVSHSARQIAGHARVVLSFAPDELVSTSVREMSGGLTTLILCARDEHGLYSRVAGCLTAVGINILASQVYTMREGMALEIYRLSTPPGSEVERHAVWEKLDQTLKDVLSGDRELEAMVQQQRPPIGRKVTPSRRPPSVGISNEVSDFYTVVDLAANDRLGLLYDLTRTLANHGLEIFLSKASTVLDQVADTFYVKGRDGKKLTDPLAIESLRRDLLQLGGGNLGHG
jgi:[protein-PII] uridylyltransferase